MTNDSLSRNFGFFLMDFINAIKDEHLSWKENTQERRSKLQANQQKTLVEIQQDIIKIKKDFENKMAEDEAIFSLKMNKIKLKQEQDLKDYDRFLKNIAKLRDELKQFYPDMPDILLDIIYDYAKQLFYQMWETPDPQEKISCKREYIKFLIEVNEDTNPNSLTGSSNALPQKTLKYIEASNT